MASVIQSPFLNSAPPIWASGRGQDKFGYYADFSIPTGDGSDRYWEFVSQRMRWIPAGTFLMGSPESEHDRRDNEGPQHMVTISQPFWMMQTAVPQELWNAVMAENPSHFQDEQNGRLPVENCDWDQSVAFCDAVNQNVPGLNLRLPTEAEWEYACRSGTESAFAFGDDITTDQANFDGNYPYRSHEGIDREKTISVDDLYQNPWGLIQMHGNVRDWCADWYAEYSAETQVDPEGPKSGSTRVMRGGSWISHASWLRSAYRSYWLPGARFYNLGLRCVSSVTDPNGPS